MFAEHPHAVSERIGKLKLCLKKVPGTQVAPNVTVNVMLEELSDTKLGMKIQSSVGCTNENYNNHSL